MRRKIDIQPVFGDDATLYSWVARLFTACFVVSVLWLLTHLHSPAPFYGGWTRDAFLFALFIDAAAMLALAVWVRDHGVTRRHLSRAVLGFLITLTPLCFLTFDTANRLGDWHSPQRDYRVDVTQ